MAKSERIYQVKIKVSQPGFKNEFLLGLVITTRPKRARKEVFEKIKPQLLKDHPKAKMEVTKVKYIKNEFTINTFKSK